MTRQYCAKCGGASGGDATMPCPDCAKSGDVVLPNRRDRRRQKHRPKEQLAAPWSIAPNTKIFP